MAEVNVDAGEVESVFEKDKKMKLVSMMNGCICCTLRDDLLEQVYEIATGDQQFDYLVIESKGI